MFDSKEKLSSGTHCQFSPDFDSFLPSTFRLRWRYITIFVVVVFVVVVVVVVVIFVPLSVTHPLLPVLVLFFTS